MIAKLLSLIGGATGFGAVGSALVATGALFLSVFGVSWAALHIHDGKVIAVQNAKIDGATIHATSTIRTSAARSGDPSVLGKRDPTTKDD